MRQISASIKNRINSGLLIYDGNFTVIYLSCFNSDTTPKFGHIYILMEDELCYEDHVMKD